MEFYWLDDRYDFDLYSLQKGDSITLHYPHMSIDNGKSNSYGQSQFFQERIRENDSIYVDIDFLTLKKKLGLPPLWTMVYSLSGKLQNDASWSI